VEAFFVSTLFDYLDTSKTSTGVAKEEAKKQTFYLLVRHISILHRCFVGVNVEKKEPLAAPSKWFKVGLRRII
jgi:hypothetical protein